MRATLRLQRRRLRRSRGRTLAAAALGALALAGLAALALTAQRGLPWRATYDLHADFANAANLAEYADVRIAGKRVGQVTSVRSRGGVAHVGLQLERAIAPLPATTTARIRLKGLLGAKFVELHPGRGRATLPDGATIPASRTTTTVDLFDVLQSLDGPRRADLRATLRALGEGFIARGEDVNPALRVAPVTLRDATAFTDAVNARTGAARRLVPSLNAAAAAFDAAREDMARGFGPQAQALAPFADRRADVQAALTLAPPALDAVRTGLAESDPLLVQVAGLARATVRFSRPAPAALDAAAALMRAGDAPLRTARALLAHTAAAIPPALRMTGTLDPLLDPWTRSMRTNVPGLQALGARSCDVLGQLRNWRDALSWGVPSDGPLGYANVFRAALGVNLDSVADVPAKAGAVIGHHPYRAPCEAG